MNDTYSAIKTAILAKLNSLSKPKHVYGYEKGELDGYPAITLFSSEYNPLQFTTQHDKDTYVFTLNVYQEMQSDNTTPEDAEAIVDALLVEVIQAFQEDPTLDGACENLTVAAQKGWVDREIINRAAVVTITAEKVVNVDIP